MTELAKAQTAGPRRDAGEAGAFLHALGMTIKEVTGTRVTAEIEFGPEHRTPWGIVHGGVYCTIIESVTSIGATAAIKDRGQVAVGLTNTTHFLRPLTEGAATVEATPLHQGRAQQLWRADITDQSGRLIAHGEVRLQNVAGETRDA